MNKTENEYAEALIEKYNEVLSSVDTLSSDIIGCAIIDVENTIEALDEICILQYGHNKIDIGQFYYQNILQILKDKL